MGSPGLRNQGVIRCSQCAELVGRCAVNSPSPNASRVRVLCPPMMEEIGPEQLEDRLEERIFGR
jgi:hypothetical protein